MNRRKVTLTIAGLDPTGGAGIVADAIRMAREGVHPLAVATALTTQSTRGVTRVAPVPIVEFRAQLRELFKDISVTSVKTGLIPTAAHVKAIVECVPPRIPIVVDPVLASSGGHAFIDEAGVIAICKLLIPRAAMVTPNLDEADLLSGVCAHSPAGAIEAGKVILQMGARAVLVKGGHGGGERLTDILLTGRTLQFFHGSRIGDGAHGTGCALSAVIAARLALGDSPVEAVRAARRRLRSGLKRAWKPGRGRAIAGI